MKGKNVRIEKGLNIIIPKIIPIHQIQRDAEYYPKPNSFIPERFGKEFGGMKAFRDKGVFLPFGDGPRACLGTRFAILQTKAAIVEVLKTFKISVNSKTAANLVFDPAEFMNIKKGGLWIDFKPVKMFDI